MLTDPNGVAGKAVPPCNKIDDFVAALFQAKHNAQKLSRGWISVPTSEGDAYRVQNEVLEAEAASKGFDLEEEIVAWKIGGTALGAQKNLGLPGPFFSPILTEALYSDGDTLSKAGPLFVESEYAIRLRSDLPPTNTPFHALEVAQAIGGVHAALEIVESRIEGGTQDLGWAAIADSGLNKAVVIGPELPKHSLEGLVDTAVSLQCLPVEQEPATVTERVQGRFEDLIWSNQLVLALSWLANHPYRRHPLRAGQFVLTGTCTGVVPLCGISEVGAEFSGLGKVSVRLADKL